MTEAEMKTTGFRQRIESGFENWGHTVSARPLLILLTSLVFVALCASGLPRVTLDVSFETFLGKDDPVRVAYSAFRDQFGRDERVTISVEPGPNSKADDVFDLAFLERLRSLHQAIEERVPYVAEVTSLVNARDTRGVEDTLLVEDFLDPWPETEENLDVLRARALANPLFRNNTISEDGGITTIVIELQLYSSVGSGEEEYGGFEMDEGADIGQSRAAAPPPLLSGAEEAEFVTALRKLLAEFDGPEVEVHAAGSVLIFQSIATAMQNDMPRFVGLAILSIAILLFILFRRLVAVLAPLVVVIFSVLCTFGLMGWTGVSVHVPTQILPSFLLAVGVGDAVHLLAIFFERIRRGDRREDALAFALGHSGLALVLTSLTTAAGLMSFASAGIAPVAALGIFAPIGVMIALGLSLTLLPALLQLSPIGIDRRAANTSNENGLDRVLAGFGRFATQHARMVVGASAILIVSAAAAASQLTLSHDPLGWLDDSTPVVVDTKYIDERLKGSISFEVLLETEASDGVRQPKALAALAALGHSLETVRRDGLVAGQTTSLADVTKEINRALNADREDAYRIPDDPQLISQELLLFESSGSDDLEDLVDSDYTMARMAVRIPWRDAVRYTKFLESAKIEMNTTLGEFGTPSMTGILALLSRAIKALVTSLAQSYLIAFATITPLMILLLGNLRMGLLAMIPNTVPIILTLGLMAILGLPLDAFSLLIGGIAMGLAVDDTIHFMHNYRRYREQGLDLEAAVSKTLLSAGRAMLFTTIVLTTGFFGFVLSSMHNLTSLGILVSFAIVTAFFADVLLAPALLVIFDREPEIVTLE